MKRALIVIPIVVAAAAVVGKRVLTWRATSVPAVAAQQTPASKSKPQKQTRESANTSVAEIDKPDEYDRTPLMLVAARNDIPAAKRLLAQGADVNAASSDDYTALMYAAYYGNAEMVEFLLDEGAEVNARHKSGLTALIEAAKQNLDAGDVIAKYVGTVKALLKKGADVSVKDKNGWTALMYAEKYGHRNKDEIVRLLRDAGAKE